MRRLRLSLRDDRQRVTLLHEYLYFKKLKAGGNFRGEIDTEHVARLPEYYIYAVRQNHRPVSLRCRWID